jgi:hypothetical protein
VLHHATRLCLGVCNYKAIKDSPQPGDAAITTSVPGGNHNLMLKSRQRVGVGLIVTVLHQVIKGS